MTALHSWFETASGARCDLFDAGATPEFTGLDLVLGCARLCRYGGKIDPSLDWYSVAEHQWHLVRWAQANLNLDRRELRTLAMHDAGEGLLGIDAVRPIKAHLPDLKALEARAMEVIAERFDLIWPLPDWLHVLDLRILFDERRAMMLNGAGNVWESENGMGAEPLGIRDFRYWEPRQAAREYRALLCELGVHSLHWETGRCA